MGVPSLHALVGLSMLAVAACGSSDATVYVDVRSDFAPGLEVDTIRVELAASADAPASRTTDEALNEMQDLFGGLRAADFDGVAPGHYVVRASLLAGGASIARTTAAVDVSGDTAVTVVVARSCAGISCPTLSDAPAETSCSGGRCVTPECAGGAGEGCDPPACSRDADCPAGPTCTVARCVSGVCLAPVDESCTVPDAGSLMDAGSGDGGGSADGGGTSDAGIVDATVATDAPPLVGLDELVLWYPFATGDPAVAVDWSGNMLHGSCTSCPTYRMSGTLSYRNFDGTQSIFRNDAALLRTTTGLSLSMWVRPGTAVGRTQTLVSKTYGTGESYRVDVTSALSVRFIVGAVTLSATPPTSLGWTHLVVRWSPGSMAIFFDGALEAEMTGPSMISFDSGRLLVGARSDGIVGLRDHATGDVDDFRVYETALSDEDIAALHAAGPL